MTVTSGLNYGNSRASKDTPRTKEEFENAFKNPIISVSFESGETNVNRISDYLKGYSGYVISE